MGPQESPALNSAATAQPLTCYCSIAMVFAKSQTTGAFELVL